MDRPEPAETKEPPKLAKQTPGCDWLLTDESDSLSALNFDWSELLRILQEEYTKLVL